LGKSSFDHLVLRQIILSFSLLAIASTFTLAQNTPGPPTAPQPQIPSEQKKEESRDENPAALTGRMTVEAAEATIRMGQAAMVRARNWENSWITGVYIEQGRTMLPLTLAERRELYLQQTLVTPGAYLKRMFAAGIDQARDAPPQWDANLRGYGARFASREGQFISSNSLAALGNAALGYEPRYDQCQCSGFWPRTRHAIMRNFVTYNHSEQELRPQFGLYGGAFAGGLISSSWKPHPRSAWADGGYAVLGQAGYGALLNFFIEFAGDINKKIGLQRSGATKKISPDKD